MKRYCVELYEGCGRKWTFIVEAMYEEEAIKEAEKRKWNNSSYNRAVVTEVKEDPVPEGMIEDAKKYGWWWVAR